MDEALGVTGALLVAVRGLGGGEMSTISFFTTTGAEERCASKRHWMLPTAPGGTTGPRGRRPSEAAQFLRAAEAPFVVVGRWLGHCQMGVCKQTAGVGRYDWSLC